MENCQVLWIVLLSCINLWPWGLNKMQCLQPDTENMKHNPGQIQFVTSTGSLMCSLSIKSSIHPFSLADLRSSHGGNRGRMEIQTSFLNNTLKIPCGVPRWYQVIIYTVIPPRSSVSSSGSSPSGTYQVNPQREVLRKPQNHSFLCGGAAAPL